MPEALRNGWVSAMHQALLGGRGLRGEVLWMKSTFQNPRSIPRTVVSKDWILILMVRLKNAIPAFTLQSLEIQGF